MLSIASYRDLKYREVDPWYWIIFGVISIPIYLLGLGRESMITYTLYSLIAPGITLLLALTGFIGFADFFALLILVFLIPKPFPDNLLPPTLVILILSNVILLITVLPFVISSIRYYGLIRSSCGSFLRTLVILSTGFPMRVREYLRKNWFVFPLVYSIEEGSEIKRICRTSFDVSEDPKDLRNKVREFVEKYSSYEEEIIIVTWGAPLILYIFIATLLYPFVAGYVESLLRSLVNLFI